MTWPLVPLGELGADTPNACVGGPFGSELTTRDYVDEGVPVIRGTNLADHGFVDDGFVFVSEAKAESLRQNQARSGDIAFTQRGTIGQVSLIPERSRYPRYVISQSQMKLTPDLQRVDPRYLVHYFKSPRALAHLKGNTLATGVPHINLTILRRVPVPLAPLAEQRRIADILDKADAIRRKRKEAIALTEELLRSAFLEMFGDPVTNPKGFLVKPLGELVEIRGGGTPSRARTDLFAGSIPWATAKDFRADVLTDTEEHVSEAALAASATKLVPAGSILVVVKSKILMRRLPVAIAGVPLCFNQDVKALVVRRDDDGPYLAKHIRLAQRQLLDLARGVNTEGLTLAHLRGHMVMQPPASMLRTYAVLERRARRALEKISEGSEVTGTLFNSLLSRAFSGALEKAR